VCVCSRLARSMGSGVVVHADTGSGVAGASRCAHVYAANLYMRGTRENIAFNCLENFTGGESDRSYPRRPGHLPMPGRRRPARRSRSPTVSGTMIQFLEMRLRGASGQSIQSTSPHPADVGKEPSR
jgi:hypothetical protein